MKERVHSDVDMIMVYVRISITICIHVTYMSTVTMLHTVIIIITLEKILDWVYCLMTHGLSKDIRCHV